MSYEEMVLTIVTEAQIRYRLLGRRRSRYRSAS